MFAFISDTPAHAIQWSYTVMLKVCQHVAKYIVVIMDIPLEIQRREEWRAFAG